MHHEWLFSKTCYKVVQQDLRKEPPQKGTLQNRQKDPVKDICKFRPSVPVQLDQGRHLLIIIQLKITVQFV
jgi:hypothetical protein